MIFRARMQQSKATLAPYWLPFIGNFVALAKCAIRGDANGLGRDVVASLPSQLLQDSNGLVPPVVAFNSTFDTGVLLMNTCQNVDKMLLKNAKSIDKSDDIERLFKGFGGTSFVF